MSLLLYSSSLHWFSCLVSGGRLSIGEAVDDIIVDDSVRYELLRHQCRQCGVVVGLVLNTDPVVRQESLENGLQSLIHDIIQFGDIATAKGKEIAALQI